MKKVLIGYLVLWAWMASIRRRGELDIPLDPFAAWVRWVTFGALFGVTWAFVGRNTVIAVSAYLMSLAILSWPNLAYWLTRGLRLGRLAPVASAEYERKMRIYWGSPTEADLRAGTQEK